MEPDIDEDTYNRLYAIINAIQANIGCVCSDLVPRDPNYSTLTDADALCDVLHDEIGFLHTRNALEDE